MRDLAFLAFPTYRKAMKKTLEFQIKRNLEERKVSYSRIADLLRHVDTYLLDHSLYPPDKAKEYHEVVHSCACYYSLKFNKYPLPTCDEYLAKRPENVQVAMDSMIIIDHSIQLYLDHSKSQDHSEWMDTIGVYLENLNLIKDYASSVLNNTAVAESFA